MDADAGAGGVAGHGLGLAAWAGGFGVTSRRHDERDAKMPWFPTDVEAKQRAEAAAHPAEATAQQERIGRDRAEATPRELTVQLGAERAARTRIEAELALLRGTAKPPARQGPHEPKETSPSPPDVLYAAVMTFVFACIRRARPVVLGAVLMALIPLAAGCSDVRITPGATASAGSSESTVSSSSAGGSGGVGGSSNSGGAPSDGGAGGGGGSIVIPSTAWAVGAGSLDGNDLGTSVAVDAAGEVFVTGVFHGDLDLGAGPLAGYPLNAPDPCFLAKFGPSGEPLWAKKIPAYTRVAVDAQGSLWLNGFTEATEFLGDGPSQQLVNGYFLARYTLDGALQWATTIAPLNQVSKTVVVPTSNGGVVVLGLMGGASSVAYGGISIAPLTQPVDIFALAVDSTGKAQWGRALGADLVSKPTVSLLYEFAGAGIKGGGLIIHAGVNTVKLDSKGKTVWTKHPSDAPSHDNTTGARVTVVPGGEVVISGQLEDGQTMTFGAKLLTGPKIYVVKLDPQGEPIWSTSLDHNLAGIGSDPAGVVSVAVYGGGSSSQVDLIRLSPAGAVLSKHSFTDASAGGDSTVLTAGVAVDHGGNALITGLYIGSVDFGTGALPPTSSTGMTDVSNVFIAKLVP